VGNPHKYPSSFVISGGTVTRYRTNGRIQVLGSTKIDGDKLIHTFRSGRYIVLSLVNGKTLSGTFHYPDGKPPLNAEFNRGSTPP